MGAHSYQLKAKAIQLRRLGFSIPQVEAQVRIPRSTLSGWFRSVTLTAKQRDALHKRWQQGLVTARKKAALWHSSRKQQRIELMKKEVDDFCSHPFLKEKIVLEVALAMLYLGEGTKRKSELGLGNSDPKIIKFYIDALEKLYGISRTQMSVQLHLRADQDEQKLKTYWSRQADIPLGKFGYVLRDKRTAGKPTYPGYNGVCYIRGGGVAIQRRLLYLSERLCKGR